MTHVDPASNVLVRRSRGNFLTGIGAGLVSLLIIILIGVLVAHSAAWTTAEMSILEAISLRHTPGLDAFTLGINYVFGPPVAAVLVVMTSVAILGASRRVSTAIQFAVVVTGSWLGSEVIKVLVDRPRPDHLLLAHPLIIETSSSYPSGHTAFAASLAMGLIVLARGRIRRTLAIVAGLLGVALVAFSRVYLGVHYVSDVAASMVYSVVAVSLLTALWRRYVTPRIRAAEPRMGTEATTKWT